MRSLIWSSYAVHHEKDYLQNEHYKLYHYAVLHDVVLSTSHVLLLFRTLAATLPLAVRTGILPAEVHVVTRHAACRRKSGHILPDNVTLCKGHVK